MWQIRSQEAKDKISLRKKCSQDEFRAKMGLLVDQRRTGGSGTSNDGNTARKFFSNPEISAEITGIDKNLIIRVATLLQALSSGYKINSAKFGDYALETAKQLIDNSPIGS